MDILNDLLYLGAAVVFFALSFGLIAAFDRMMGGSSTKTKKERES